MRFELALVLNWRKHLMDMAVFHHPVFSEKMVRIVGVGSAVKEMLDGRFILLPRMKRIYEQLKPYDFPYPLEPPTVEKSPYNNRATVREAYQISDNKLLLLSISSPSAQKRIYSEMKKLEGKYAVVGMDGYNFIYADLTHNNVNMLRSKRWNVYAPIIDDAEVPLPVLPEGTLDDRLFPYQVEGVRMLMAGYRLLADEQGLGKTIQAAQYIKAMGLGRILVCCPSAVKYNWREEIAEWSDIPKDRIIVLSGRKAYGGKALEGCRVAIINYDILSSWSQTLNTVPWDLVISDECHYIQNDASQRTQAFLALRAKDKVFMSGTPFTSRPYQMFTALHSIAPKIFSNATDYGLQFCGPTVSPHGNLEFKGASNLDVLHKILMNGICIRRLKSEVLDQLPEKMRVTVTIMTEHSKLLKDKEAVAEIKELQKQIDACKNPMATLDWQKQITYLMKRDAVFEWIDDFLTSGKKLVVFAIHKRAIDDLMSRYGDIAVKVDGSVSDINKQKAKEAFQTDDRIRLFVGNVKAAGAGITLTAASDTCTIELGWSCSDHLQAEDRVHRIGQTRGVKSYYMCAPDTIDMTLIQIINQKAKMHKQIFDGTDDNMLAQAQKMMQGMSFKKVI